MTGSQALDRITGLLNELNEAAAAAPLPPEMSDRFAREFVRAAFLQLAASRGPMMAKAMMKRVIDNEGMAG